MEIGRKIFYDKVTGVQIVDTGQYDNAIRAKTIDEEILSYPELSERNRETFDVLELPFRAYQQELTECTGYRVDVVTKTLEFSYPDPNNPGAPPVYQKPLTEQILQLKESQNATNRIVEGQGTSQQDLLELLIDMGVI